MATRLPPDPGIVQRLMELIGMREPAQLPVAGRVAIQPNMFPQTPDREELLPPSKEFVRMLDSLVNAPFAQDTLFPMTGGEPDTIGAGGLSENVQTLFEMFKIPREKIAPIGVLGQTRTDDQAVQINELASFGNSLENTLIHEMGHVLDLGTKPVAVSDMEGIHSFLAGLFEGGRTPEQVHMSYLRDRLLEDLERLRKLDPDGEKYAAVNPTEHIASTFVNAVNLLRDPETTQEAISEADTGLPGVRNMTDFLLEHMEIFSGHPLNRNEK